MFTKAVTILILFCHHSANFQGEGSCGTSIEMRTVALDKQLAAMGCENYHCGKLMNIEKQSGQHASLNCISEAAKVSVSLNLGY